MKQNIWIMNHYAGNMYFDRGGRHYSFAKYLRRAGYAPVIFCANTKHGQAEHYLDTPSLWTEQTAEEIDTPFVFVKARTYSGNGKQRILNMIDFYRNVQKTAVEYAARHGKPNVIYASSVHPLTLVAGIRLAKRFGVKCICEVRDLWPESIVAYSTRFTGKNPLIRLLYCGERWIYKKADGLIFTMEGAYDYIVERGWEKDIPRAKVHYINNGVDLEVFEYNREHFQVEDSDLSDPSIFKVVYTGSIRQVNNLALLLNVAKEINNSRVRFLIWGDGDEREALELRVQKEHIENVIFKGREEKKFVPSIVSRADVNFIDPISDNVAKYGISANKLFEYLAAGKPILMQAKGAYNPVKTYRAGVSLDTLDPADLAAQIDRFAGMDAQEYGAYCAGALAAAEEYDFKRLTDKLLAVIEGIASK